MLRISFVDKLLASVLRYDSMKLKISLAFFDLVRSLSINLSIIEKTDTSLLKLEIKIDWILHFIER